MGYRVTLLFMGMEQGITGYPKIDFEHIIDCPTFAIACKSLDSLLTHIPIFSEEAEDADY